MEEEAEDLVVVAVAGVDGHEVAEGGAGGVYGPRAGAKRGGGRKAICMRNNNRDPYQGYLCKLLGRRCQLSKV